MLASCWLQLNYIPNDDYLQHLSYPNRLYIARKKREPGGAYNGRP